MLRITHKGDFSKTTNFLKKAKLAYIRKIAEKYGKKGVAALESATPVETGVTAKSWFYKIEGEGWSTSIVFCNSNVVNGVPIAIILQYGHGTRNGGWVEGRDYINPALQPIMDELAKKAWEEVTKL